MTAIIRHPFRFKNLRSTLKNITEEKDVFYLMVGRSRAWTNDLLPDQPEVDPYAELQARYSIQAAKKLVNIAPCAPRYNWVLGNTYSAYDSTDPELHTRAYYVLNTTSFNVYMCLKAGAGASTSEPTGIDDNVSFGGTVGVSGSSIPQVLADGYIWKYMYTIDAVSANRYLTTNFMPVLRDEEVSANARRGAIHRIKIVNGGVGYGSAPTLAIQGDGTGATATCTISGGVINSITITNIGLNYTYARVVITGGGSPSVAATLIPIIAPQSEGRELEDVQIVLGGTSYANGSLELLVDGDGFDATVTATVTGGVIQSSPTINTPGWGYTQATITPAKTTTGTTATLLPIWSGPKGGFGYDPVVEMNAFYLMLNVTLDGAEGTGDFVPSNDYRQLMIIQNPLDLQTNQQAFTETTGRGMKRHTVSAGGTWVQDDLITGSSSGAKAYIVFYDTVNHYVYYYQNETTGFANFSAEAVTGLASSAGTITVANTAPEFDRFTGKMLYLENRAPVSRAIDQIEDIKITVQF